MPTYPTLNGKAAAVASCDGLNFVLRTATPSHGQDDDNGYIRLLAARRKPL